ncbi:MAG: 50S ribosomal protein L9 [Candidatus Omnitrophota bacterium]|nr:50S ribosomal protein L9 [Candidatus Omnitrophota bacterium]
MELILLKDVPNVGFKGEIIRVREGFGRNFLLPRRLAVSSSQASQLFIEKQKVRLAKRVAGERAQAEKQVEQLKQLTIQIPSRSGDQGKLYGSITADHICDALSQKGYQFRKKQIRLKDAIRTLGVHPVTIEVYPQVKATLSIEVVTEA